MPVQYTEVLQARGRDASRRARVHLAGVNEEWTLLQGAFNPTGLGAGFEVLRGDTFQVHPHLAHNSIFAIMMELASVPYLSQCSGSLKKPGLITWSYY